MGREKMKRTFGGIEAGGTKFVCAVGTGPEDILDEVRFETTTPDETLGKAAAFLKKYQEKIGLEAVGIATFGPVDLDPKSPTYGYITATPKRNWSNTNFVGFMESELKIPVGFDTDVNGALLGEYHWGALQGVENAIYLTIGTGIGGGAMVNGYLIHGLVHPEMGHVMLPKRRDDPYPEGNCPYHGSCLEGMASGPSIARKWGKPAHELPPKHPAWDLEAYYLAVAIHGFICTLSPQRIILGGGVMRQKHLFPLIRMKLLHSLNNYVQNHVLVDETEDYIVPPALGNKAGVLGAFALAKNVIK
jgi:fructokinase